MYPALKKRVRKKIASMQTVYSNRLRVKCSKQLLNNMWTFPIVLAIFFISLSTLGIHGSSIGVYYKYLYGDSSMDKNLIFGKPRPIRSDEWLVNTQKILSQTQVGFSSINKNTGNGEDVTLLYDIPSKNWSVLLKPQNLVFLIAPVWFAFAFHWWFMQYLLILSAYFFIYVFLGAKFKNRTSVSILLSLILFFSPFLQWWNQYVTFAPIYYCLFALTLIMLILRSNSKRKIILYSSMISYFGAAFILVMYPPFQIACLLVSVFFAIGYILDSIKKSKIALPKYKLLSLIVAICTSLCIVGYYASQHKSTINATINTAYPGQRITKSGGYNLKHLSAYHLNGLLQDDMRAEAYLSIGNSTGNQSGSSNFIYLLPLTIFLAAFLVYKNRNNKHNHKYTLLSLTACFSLFVSWLFIPNLDILGAITLLNKVPTQRLLIGLGLLDFMLIIVTLKSYANTKSIINKDRLTVIFLFFVYCYTIIGLYVHNINPAILGVKEALLLALPLPIIYVFIISKRYILGLLILLIFIASSSISINPLYHGFGPITNTQISSNLVLIDKQKQNAIWVNESVYSEKIPHMTFENLTTVNGLRTFSGVFLYPQSSMWKNLESLEYKNAYNRYAHITFTFDDGTPTPVLSNPFEDQLDIRISPCDQFFKKNNINMVLSTRKWSSNKCSKLLKAVTYPNVTFFIYELI